MTDVSCKLLADLRDHLVARGLDVAAWRAPVALPDQALFDRRRRAPWDESAVLIERFEEAVGGEAGLAEFMAASFSGNASWTSGLFSIGRLALSPRTLYWMGNTIAGPLAFGPVEPRFKAIDDTRFELELTLPERFRPCPTLWRASVYSLRLAPRWIGLPESTVKVEYGPHWARYEIQAPRSATLWSRVRTFLRLMLQGQRVFNDFVRQQGELLTTLRTLENTQAELRALNEQLDERVRERTAQLLEAKLKAEAANLAKSTFVANMSHEVRTPLTAILGFTEYLLATEPSRDELKRRLEVIRRNASHLLELLNDVLDLAQIEAGGNGPPRAAPVVLAAELQIAADTCQPLAQARGLTFSLDLAPDLPATIVTDGLRLRQILSNLLGNALKFTEQGGIAVRARRLGPDAVEICVRDTGCGIAEEHRAKLFLPFSQGDASSTRRFGGSGLGLHLAREYARLLGGDVTLVESSPSAGSAFALRLPLSPPSTGATP